MTKVIQSEKPVENRPEEVYIQELQCLFDELSNWTGCPIERIRVIIDIFSYVDENIEKVKHDVSLKSLHDSVRNRAKVALFDIAVGSSTVDPLMLENLKKLSVLCISVLGKLG